MEELPKETKSEKYISELYEGLTHLFESFENVTFELESNAGTSIALTAHFPEDISSLTKDSFFDKLSRELNKIGVKVILSLGSGPLMETWRIDRPIIDGKFNWGMFVPYPQKFSSENKDVLNRISGSEILQSEMEKVNGDLLHKFARFVGYARQHDLITEDEKKNIEKEYYHVAHY